MERFTGLFGIVLILGLAFALSNNRRAINYRLVLSGLAIQFGLAVFILKTTIGQRLFAFLGAGIASCLVNPVIATLGLWFVGTVAVADLPMSMSVWWIGDLLGVMIATPIILTLLGRPRNAWAPRRLSVGLTLALVTLLLVLGIRQVAQWNAERVRTAFGHDAANAVQALGAQLREPLQALEALNGVFIASNSVDAGEMQLATRAWLVPGRLQAMTWTERVQREDLPAFEAAVRAERGMKRFEVFDRRDAASAASAPWLVTAPWAAVRPSGAAAVPEGKPMLDAAPAVPLAMTKDPASAS